MLNNRFFYLIFSVVIIGMLSGCGSSDDDHLNSDSVTPKNSAGNSIAAKFHPTLDIKEEEKDVIVKYNVKNLSGASKKLSFSNGLEADFVLYDQNGHILKRHSQNVLSSQALKEMTLKNNQVIEKVFKIPGLVNGDYKIEVFLLANEEQAKVVTEFKVEHSIYTKGHGKLTGLMDPHTIEVNQDGEAVAYQLSTQAREEVTSLKDGIIVSFIYSENGNGQKVIQWFENK
ncbi:BsuPI-related putative proteinase inhibitor [Neobacillus mesonae]|uniref:BsuPI-related putative proteinase inhibitor n=1 Tax=Neobacillus mesonae TaxID=1193713 RepID=UPI00203F479C|nr:BsuPI-related putative proteinase inhibitor [Neobacillus mesonae]MCM3570394.1 BsuPI-related putative proteinase inhibitor [Neobacillus mesonae]